MLQAQKFIHTYIAYTYKIRICIFSSAILPQNEPIARFSVHLLFLSTILLWFYHQPEGTLQAVSETNSLDARCSAIAERPRCRVL